MERAAEHRGRAAASCGPPSRALGSVKESQEGATMTDGPCGTNVIGRTGVWIRTDTMTARETAELARRVEALGYGAFWFPEIRGRNAFVQAGWLLAATQRLHVATSASPRAVSHRIAMATGSPMLTQLSGALLVRRASDMQWKRV